jgi:hypothetical protein
MHPTFPLHLHPLQQSLEFAIIGGVILQRKRRKKSVFAMKRFTLPDLQVMEKSFVAPFNYVQKTASFSPAFSPITPPKVVLGMMKLALNC